MVAVLPVGQLASGSVDHTTRIWNIDMGDCMAVLKGHAGGVGSLVWSLGKALLDPV